MLRRPPPVYKYIERRWGNVLLDEGRIRIGTLSYYRDVEKHGATIGDAGEGTRAVREHVDRWASGRDRQLSPYARQFFQVDPRAGPVLIANTQFGHDEQKDVYVYCVSSECSQRLRKRLERDDCIEITRPFEFVSHLAEALADRIDPVQTLGGPCVYRSREVSPTDNTPIFLLKPQEYAEDREVRAVWLPKKLPIEPVDLCCPELRRLCRRVH